MPWIFPEWDAIGLVASCWSCRPVLAASSLVALMVAMTLPFTPIGHWSGFVPPPPVMLAGIGLIVLAYLVCAEVLKPVAVRGLDATIQRPLRVLN